MTDGVERGEHLTEPRGRGKGPPWEGRLRGSGHSRHWAADTGQQSSDKGQHREHISSRAPYLGMYALEDPNVALEDPSAGFTCIVRWRIRFEPTRIRLPEIQRVSLRFGTICRTNVG
jgi:hypothetical protein